MTLTVAMVLWLRHLNLDLELDLWRLLFETVWLLCAGVTPRTIRIVFCLHHHDDSTFQLVEFYNSL